MQTQTPSTALSTSIKIPGELKERIQNLAEVRQRTPTHLCYKPWKPSYPERNSANLCGKKALLHGKSFSAQDCI